MALTQAEIDALRDKIAKSAPFQQITEGDRTTVLRSPAEAERALALIGRKNRIRTRVMSPSKAL